MAKVWLENNEVKCDMDLSIFNDAQIGEILLGLEKNLDVTIYAKPDYNCAQMREIRLGLMKILMLQSTQSRNTTSIRWKKFD